MTRPRVATGADRLLDEGFARLRGARVGLVCNHTSVAGTRLVHLADALAAEAEVTLAALFGPEHGIRGEAQDMDGVEAGRDPRTGVAVHSLYGTDRASLSPTPASLEGLDVLVFDLQDVGSRYYTFQATMALCLEAAAKAGVKVMVLDRPNPLGGVAVEGGTVEAGFESFVGLHPIPVRHGMTMGELARHHRTTLGIEVDLEVVEMEGWRRAMTFEDTGLDWIAPSPNMPTLDTAFVYPGMCLVEGTELSEGRGTTRPFEAAGAPFVDGHALAERLERLVRDHPVGEVLFRPCTFRPTFQKHAGVACGGVFLHVRERTGLMPYRLGLLFLAAVHDLWPEVFAWRARAYEFVEDVPAIDLLTGSAAAREAIEAGSGLGDVIAASDAEAARFREARAPSLLYT